MAVFTPQAQSITPEAPVSAPAGVGVAALAAGANVLGSLFENRQEAADDKRELSLRNLFVKDLEEVRGLMDEGRTDEAQIAARNIQANYVSLGGDWNEESRSIASGITGIPSSNWGMTQQDRDRQALEARRSNLLQDEEFNGYLSIVSRENPNLDGDALFQAAENRYNNGKSAQLLLVDAQRTGQLNFEQGGREAINTLITDFQQSSIGGLMTAFEQGQIIDPDQLTQARTNWDSLVSGNMIATLRNNVTAEQWKPIQDRIDGINRMFTNIEGAISSEGRKERLLSIYQQAVGNTAFEDMSMDELFMSILASQEVTNVVTSGVGADVFLADPANVKAITDMVQLNLTQSAIGNISGTLPKQGDGTVDLNGTINFGQLPAAIKTEIEGVDDTNIVASVRVNGKLLSSVSAQNLNDPVMANDFVNSSYRLGAWMLSTNGRPLSASVLNELGIDGSLGEKLTLIEGVGTDTNLEEAARITLRSGLIVQEGLQNGRLRALENKSQAVDAELVFDQETGDYYAKNSDVLNLLTIRAGGIATVVASEYWEPTKGLRIPRQGSVNEPIWLSTVRDGVSGGEWSRMWASRDAMTNLGSAIDSLTVDMPEDQAISTQGGYALPQEVSSDTEFLNAVGNTSNNLGINQDDLLRIIEFETAGSWSPSVKAPTSSATGLIQFIESTAESLGTSTAALAQMSRAEQMQYVEKYLEPYKGRINNFGDLYMAVHWPAGVGKEDSYVMYERGSAAYDANRSLDTNGDGTVTRGETIGRVMQATGNGRGVMTTPNTAAAEAALQAPVQTPAQASNPASGVTTEAPTMATPTQDTTQATAVPEVATTAFQGTPQRPQEPQRDTPAVDNYIPDDVQAALTAIASGGQPMTGVAAFATYEDFKKALDAGEINQGQWVIVDGRALRV